MRSAIILLLCTLIFVELGVAQDICPHDEGGGTVSSKTGVEGVELNFPNEGTINAFVIFVQHADDDFDNCLLTDEDTEWPSDWSTGMDRVLPAWAGTDGEDFLAPPGTSPANFADGSLSQFYELVSDGAFTLTGDVYPEVNIPDHNRQWYVDNRSPLPNGALKLSHELLTSQEIQDYFDTNYPGDDIDIFDSYTNGDGEDMEPDGIMERWTNVSPSPISPPCPPARTCTGWRPAGRP